MTVFTPRVDEHTRTLAQQLDEARKTVMAHEEFLRDLARRAVVESQPGLAAAIRVHMGDGGSW